MIARITGKILSKAGDTAVIEAGGVGYELTFCSESIRALGGPGQTAEVFVAESFSNYTGFTLYGFRSAAEKDLFELFRAAVPGTAAKKALDYLSKALKSLPDFKQAVIGKDLKLLVTIFGFTAKTAEKLVAALKDRMPELEVPGAPKIGGALGAGVYARAFNGLTGLGFRPGEAKAALDEAQAEGAAATVEELLTRALKRLSPK